MIRGKPGRSPPALGCRKLYLRLAFRQGKMPARVGIRLGGQLIGGWQLNGVVTTGSGTPYSVTFSPNQVGWIGNRANVIGYSQATPSNRSTINGSIPRHFRSHSRSPTEPRPAIPWGPGLFSWDTGLFKSFTIRERIRSTFRAEAFNTTNHTSFSNPATNLSIPSTVGSITGTSVAARTIQFGPAGRFLT